MARERIYTGCRDCRNCTNSSVAHGARKAGRGLAAVGSLGMSEVGMAMSGKCRACGHQMSLHGEARAPQPQVVVQARETPQGPPPGWYPDPRGGPAPRWWDGVRWTVTQLLPPEPQMPQLSAAPSLPPAGWYGDPEGEGHRYWDGTTWTEHRAP